MRNTFDLSYVMRKSVLYHMRTTKAQISLRIRSFGDLLMSLVIY